MGRPLIRLTDSDGTDWYFEFSTISDAPTTYRMTRDELVDYIREEYGAQGVRELKWRLERLDAKGTSSLRDPDAESTILCNRAGPRETRWTAQQIADNYWPGNPAMGKE